MREEHDSEVDGRGKMRHEQYTKRWDRLARKKERRLNIDRTTPHASYHLPTARYHWRFTLLSWLKDHGVTKFPVLNTEVELIAWMERKVNEIKKERGIK